MASLVRALLKIVTSRPPVPCCATAMQASFR